MTAPTLKSASVQLIYRASDGYRMTTGFSSRMAETPSATLLAAIDELARVLALFGFEEEARSAVDDACNRVKANRRTAPVELSRADHALAADLSKVCKPIPLAR